MKPSLEVRFYITTSGKEPVRDWLMSLDRDARRIIGTDIKTVELGWPLGMPLVRKMAPGLWEVRSHLPSGIARVLFTVKDRTLVLLHGFQKKGPKTPSSDLQTALRRLKGIQDGEQD